MPFRPHMPTIVGMVLKPASSTLSIVYETLRRTVQGSRGETGAFEPGPREAAEDGSADRGADEARPPRGSGRGDKLDIKI